MHHEKFVLSDLTFIKFAVSNSIESLASGGGPF